MNSVKPNDFAVALSGIFEEFIEQTQQEIEQIIVDEAQNTLTLLKERSPKDTGRYAKGWTLKKTGKFAKGIKARGANGSVITIYNKDRYRLTHLLEKGAIRYRGGVMKPKPHITPVFEEAKNNIEQKLGGN